MNTNTSFATFLASHNGLLVAIFRYLYRVYLYAFQFITIILPRALTRSVASAI